MQPALLAFTHTRGFPQRARRLHQRAAIRRAGHLRHSGSIQRLRRGIVLLDQAELECNDRRLQRPLQPPGRIKFAEALRSLSEALRQAAESFLC